MDRTLVVDGMQCAGCEQTVADALASVDGVTDVRVDRAHDRATVSGEVEDDRLLEAIEQAGYRPRV